MATIKRRNGGNWQATYRAPDGKERTKTFALKVRAQEWIDANAVAKTRGEWVDPKLGRMTVVTYVYGTVDKHGDGDEPGWLATKADVSPTTRMNVVGRLKKHVVPFFGDMAIAAVRPSHVRGWVAGLVADGLAPSTIKATYLTASQVFAQAVVDGIIVRSPCVGVPLPPERKHAGVHFLNAEQVAALAAAIDGRYSALIYAAAYSGMRAGELSALRISRLHQLAREIEVVESMSEVGGALVPGTTKTGRRRTIGVPAFLCEMLGAELARYPSSDYVFTSAEGGPIRQRNFYRRHFKPAVARVVAKEQEARDKRRAAGVEDDADTVLFPAGLRFHDLRHTCAALLIANGQHMEEVKDHLGHSSIRVTSDRYGHLFPKARRALADGLDATFSATATNAPADISRTMPRIRAL